MWASMRSVCWLLPSIVLLANSGCRESSDVVTYSGVIPAHGPSAAPFTNPYAASNPSEPGTAATRVRVKPAAAGEMKMPAGTMPWGIAVWGKYVLVGNYDEQAQGVFQQIEDQRVGVFDMETKRFCELDLNPSAEPRTKNGSVQWLGVGEPNNAAATRVYVVGFAGPGGSDVYQFGYIEARMDTASPCDPVTGWRVIGFTGNQLNDRRVAGVTNEPCPGNTCGWDGLAVLDARTVVMHSWLSLPPRHVIAQVQAPSDELRVVAVRPTEPWKDPGSTPGTNDICYSARPVGDPAVDRTRAAGDQRFASAFDPTCDTPVNPPGCAPHVGICPNLAPPAASCSLGSNGCAGYCDRKHFFFNYVACSTTSQCRLDWGTCDPATKKCTGAIPFGCETDADCIHDQGTCVNACLPSHPGKRCSASGGPCNDNLNCTGGTDVCECGWEGKPLREYRWDGTNLTPVSGYFQPAERRGTHPQLYDSQGNLWLNDIDGPANDWKNLAIYFRDGAGHPYDSGAAVVEPSQSIRATGAGFLNGPRIAQHENSIYLSTLGRLERASLSFGIFKDGYNRFLGESELSSGAKKCFVAAENGQFAACNTDADCGDRGPCHQYECYRTACNPFVENCTRGEACSPDDPCSNATDRCEEWTGIAPRHSLPAAGSPPSLWLSVGYRGTQALAARKNVHLTRVPLQTPLPDGAVQARPGVVWTGGDCAAHPRQCRLWLVAQRSGALSFRLRDDGFWSAWRALPASTPATAGGPGVVATATGLSVFARTSTGTVIGSALTSAVTCELASCTFSGWQGVPMTTTETGVTLRTSTDVAATLVPGTPPFPALAVRDTASRQVFVTRFDPATSTWNAWSRISGAVTDVAPALGHDGSQVILAVRDDGTGSTAGQIIATPVFAATSWLPAGSAPPVARWGTAPALVNNGGYLHAFAAEPEDGNFNGRVHQVLHVAGGWGSWRRVGSDVLATLQPAGAAVGGDVNLVTRWVTDGLREQALE